MLQNLLAKHSNLLAARKLSQTILNSSQKCLFSGNKIANRDFVSFTASSSQTRRVLEDSAACSDREIDLLELKDTRFRLPGNVGVVVSDNFVTKVEHLNANATTKKQNGKFAKKPASINLTSEKLLQELTIQKPVPNIDMFLADDRQILHCDAHECPTLMVQDFQELFPNIQELSQGMTVMTISQKSINDMSAWSSNVIDERESLMEKFVFTAERMCNYLKSLGYWADFIDPSSGRPYNVSYCLTSLNLTVKHLTKIDFCFIFSLGRIYSSNIL